MYGRDGGQDIYIYRDELRVCTKAEACIVPISLAVSHAHLSIGSFGSNTRIADVCSNINTVFSRQSTISVHSTQRQSVHDRSYPWLKLYTSEGAATPTFTI
jgi:hypothetical protein